MAAGSSTVVCIFVHLLTSTGARSGTALQVFDWSQHSTPHSRLQSLIFAAIYRFPHRWKSRLLSSFFRTYWKTSKSIRCQRNDSMQVYGCSSWHYLFRSETIDGICCRSDFVYFPEPSSLCHRHRNVKSSTIPITQKWYHCLSRKNPFGYTAQNRLLQCPISVCDSCRSPTYTISYANCLFIKFIAATAKSLQSAWQIRI